MLSKFHLPCLLLFLVSCAGSPGTEQKPVPLHNAKAGYPPVAELHGRKGFVALDCTITETGRTRDCTATAGDHDFVASALNYMSKAEYKPGLRDGVPVAYTHYTLGVHFYATAPRPIALAVHCSVTAAGIIRTCRPDAASPPPAWPMLKLLVEGARITPCRNGELAIDDPARALCLLFAFVHLPWFGPEPKVEGDVSISALFNCERHSIAPGRDSLACRPEDSKSGSTGADATEHVRAYLGINSVAPPLTGDFSDLA